MNKGFLIIAGVAIILIGAFFVFSPRNSTAPADDQAGSQMAEDTAPRGNIDETVSAILNDIQADEAPTAENDPSLLSEDDQAVNDFGNSLDIGQVSP